MEEQKKMKTSHKDNWIVKVSEDTVVAHGEGRKKAVMQTRELVLEQTNEQ